MEQANLPTCRAVSYVRGSTEEQQNTLASQQEQHKNYCTYRNIELAATFIDSGVSGGTSFYQRPAAADMLAYMQANGCTAIVISKLDRAFRNALDCLFTLEDFKKRGIDLHILDMQLDTSTPVGGMVLRMLASLAQFENEQRAERQLTAFAIMRRAHCRCGTVPFGWIPVTSVRKSRSGNQAQDLVPEPEEQRTLLWILARHNDGQSDNHIARELNAQGIPTKRNGKKWFGATVESVRTHALIPNQQPIEKAA